MNNNNNNSRSMFRFETTRYSRSSSNRYYLVMTIVTLLLCCHYHISLTNAQQQQTIPDDERIQYGLPLPQNQSLCDQGPNYSFARFVCRNSTFDGQYRIVEVYFKSYNFTDGGNPSTSLTTLSMPALRFVNFNIGQGGVINRSINLLELLKSAKRLYQVLISNDTSISYIPNDFNNFPDLMNLGITLDQPLSVPRTFLNNSVSIQSIDIRLPVSSITIDDSLFFPSLLSYEFYSNCTYGSHRINVTARSFPKLFELLIIIIILLRFITILPGSNTTVYFNPKDTKIPSNQRPVVAITGYQSTVFPYPGGSSSSLYLHLDNNFNFNGPITEPFCGITDLDIRNTSVTLLPDCVWCYKDPSESHVVKTDLVVPPGFSCNVTNQNIANIKGNNIGYGYRQSNYSIVPVIPNKDLAFAYLGGSTIPSIPTQVTINLNPHIVQMMMVNGDITIGQLTSLQIKNNITFNLILLFNSYFNHTVTIDNQNSVACTNLTNTSSTQFQCTTPLLSSGDHQLIVSNSYTASQKSFTFYSFAYLCQQSTNNCHGNGKCDVDGICLCNSNSFYNNCSKPYPIISSGNYNSTNNKNVELNGDFGPSLISNVSIMINNTIECVVESVSQFQINCILDQQPSFGLASVQLKLNNHLNTMAKDILNLQSPSQPSQPISKSECEKITFNCYGHGYCDDNGKCQCQDGYSVIDNCLTKYINTTITPNTTDPTVSFDVDGLDFDFLFEIFSVQELDLDDQVIKELFISNYTWNVNASTINNNQTTIINYQLNTTLSSSTSYQPAQVQSTISFSTLARTVEFGGQQLLINPNSIKLEVNISKCYDSLSSLQYLRVVKDGIQFNGRFIDVAMSDGRPTYSPTQLISSTPINDEQSIVKIGILFPQCQECILDPDFSALIVDTNNSGSQCDNEDSNDRWKMITGIVVGIVGAVVLSIIAFYGIKRFKRHLILNRESISMSKLDNQ
ncbi:hypothetical protein DFA_11244 [Cavenderia fasciculata]|uniref:EGF-like domain-containing protein n=1 Tax=Cavenderia fasciculata TaxID=261658 RepID=F4QFN0_CACFS|nr:uncharacterized protein DFA_11244 [Cavenderia fasciculata]EGG13483.1 hypothetical protein DFA_11244 [Cavenderia fasciculata]|eukprot:XP_004350187.1 hypothetical protein DFA_11244 [Cavenderia fasciculata]